jgi:DNA-binding transcriptional ArsR family regulator
VGTTSAFTRVFDALWRKGAALPTLQKNSSALMHAFDVLGDPVRRRILELLAAREHASGDVVAVVGREFGITQSAVSQHLKVLRESGFARVRIDAQRRLYSVDAAPLREVDAWLDPFRRYWEPRLEALATEVARGKRKRKSKGES